MTDSSSDDRDPAHFRSIARRAWNDCTACSEASFTAQNRCFGVQDDLREQAAHLLSGGVLHQGHACGLLTGAALATGLRAQQQFSDDDQRSAAVLQTTIELLAAHLELAGSTDCREITGVSLTSLPGKIEYMRSGGGKSCGRLSMDWAPLAHDLIDSSLAQRAQSPGTGECANCAVSTFRQLSGALGLAAEDAPTVAGLAGGVGLSGNVCGALATGTYALGLRYYMRRAVKKRDSWLRGALHELDLGDAFRRPATKLRLAFAERFGSLLCRSICQRDFPTPEEHAAYVGAGGCAEVIAFVSDYVGTVS